MGASELKFWTAVGLMSIASVAIFKIVASQRWAPGGLKHLAGAI